MTPDEFRAHGHEVVEWVASYMERVGELPIVPSVEPGEIRGRLPAAAPEEPEPFAALLRDLDEIVLPGITHWQSPGWFAYFPANASPPSILAELVSAGLGAQGMIWSSSPALTEIEAHVLDWLVDLLGLPEHFKTAVGPGGGVIQMSASDSTHLVHAVARERAVRGGAPIDRLVAYGSSQAHSSVERGARIAGFAHVRKLEVDDAFALRPEALREAIGQDRAAGLRPAIVTSAIGTTGTGAVDPIAAVAGIAERARPLAPRRCRVGGLGDALRGAPPAPGGRRARRQLHVQPAQVAVHQLRLQRPVGGRPRARSWRRCRSCRRICATPPPSPARSSTTATGTCRSGAASAR